MRILCVVGTRPNLIKMASLHREMRRRPGVEPILVHTGQHYDHNMSGAFLEELDLPEPDINLGVGGGSHAMTTGQIMMRFEPVLSKTEPDLVVVVGDVNSTLAAALVAAKEGAPVAHVEAGLRSGDRTMPEELNRIVVDRLADLLFTTEPSGDRNLRAEGVAEEKIFSVGNVMIDTLMTHIEKARDAGTVERCGLTPGQFALVTLHRPANTDEPAALGSILRALREIARDLPIFMPVHPRTRKCMADFGLLAEMEAAPGVTLGEPLGYLDFMNAMMHARVVLSDSGGIQEETTILGVPCLTMRNNTERPITIEMGTNRLVGTRGDDILRAWRELRDGGPTQCERPPLWDGRASERVLDAIERWRRADGAPEAIRAVAQ